jgi:hypothetical protein
VCGGALCSWDNAAKHSVVVLRSAFGRELERKSVA